MYIYTCVWDVSQGRAVGVTVQAAGSHKVNDAVGKKIAASTRERAWREGIAGEGLAIWDRVVTSCAMGLLTIMRHIGNREDSVGIH